MIRGNLKMLRGAFGLQVRREAEQARLLLIYKSVIEK